MINEGPDRAGALEQDDVDVVSWLKDEMLKGLQEECLKEVEGPFIFGSHSDGTPAWEIVYTANGWPYIIGKDPS